MLAVSVRKTANIAESLLPDITCSVRVLRYKYNANKALWCYVAHEHPGPNVAEIYS